MEKKKLYVVPSTSMLVSGVEEFCISTGTNDSFAKGFDYDEEEDEEKPRQNKRKTVWDE